MKLVTWNIQWCRGCDGGSTRRASSIDARALRRLRRALPAGGRGQLPGARGQPGRRPVRRSSPRCCPATRGRRRRRSTSPAPTAAPPLRQHDPEPAAGHAGAAHPAAVAGRSGRPQHAARCCSRPSLADAVRAAARDDDAPRVLLARCSARRRSRRCARSMPRPARHALRRPARSDAGDPFQAPAADRLGDPHRRLQPPPRGPAACTDDGAVRRRRARRRFDDAWQRLHPGQRAPADARRARPRAVAGRVRLRLHLRDRRPGPAPAAAAVDATTAASDHQPVLVEVG